MKSISSICGLCVFTLILSIFTAAHAAGRNDVFSELEKINSSWHDSSIDVWVNDFKNDVHPRVLLGDELIYRVKASDPAFFVFILVDSNGNVGVLKPDALLDNGVTGPSRSLTFPSDEQSQSGQAKITQAMPLGKETVFLLASDQLIPASVFGIDPLTDYITYRAKLKESRAMVNRLNAYSKDMRVALVRYEYFVDQKTQFSSLRGGTPPFVPPIVVEAITEKRAKLSSIYANGVAFEYDSDALTTKTLVDLRVLGGELVDLLAKNQLSRVRLTGHSDSLGSEVYNAGLSKRRSIAVKRFLVDELGLPPELFDVGGKGEAVAVASNVTNEGRVRNRRVEFEIVR